MASSENATTDDAVASHWSQAHVTDPGYEASEHCPQCGSFAEYAGSGGRQLVRWECQREDCGHHFTTYDPLPTDEDAVTGEHWTRPSADTRPRCDRCNTPVSHEFSRQWSDNDGDLDGCPQCLPRSIRFGEDIYGRSADDVNDDWDPDRYNPPADERGREPE